MEKLTLYEKWFSHNSQLVRVLWRYKWIICSLMMGGWLYASSFCANRQHSTNSFSHRNRLYKILQLHDFDLIKLMMARLYDCERDSLDVFTQRAWFICDTKLAIGMHIQWLAPNTNERMKKIRIASMKKKENGKTENFANCNNNNNKITQWREKW